MLSLQLKLQKVRDLMSVVQEEWRVAGRGTAVHEAHGLGWDVQARGVCVASGSSG